MFSAIKRKISTLSSDFEYYIARWKHSRNLPALEGSDVYDGLRLRNIFNALKKDGVCVTTLADYLVGIIFGFTTNFISQAIWV